MGRAVKPLTIKDVENAKPKAKQYTISDGGGLALMVTTQGGRYWHFNYYQPHTKKRRLISLGTFPELSLAQARAKREEFKALILQGIDPQAERQKLEMARIEAIENTFQTVAFKWYEYRQTKARFSESHAKKTKSIIDRFLLANFARRPIGQITARQVIEILEPLQAEGKLRTIREIIQVLNHIANYALHREIISANPFLKLSVEFDKPKEKHFATIEPSALADLLAKFKASNLTPRVKQAFLWQLLTLSRPAETVKAKFAEIDTNEKIWAYYVEKGRQDSEQGRIHKVTLNSQALRLLEFTKAFNNTPYLFPSSHSNRAYITSVTVINALYNLGYKGKQTAHGFRSIASTYLNEKGHNKELIEIALSHIDKDRARKAYNRAEYLQRRAEMLQEWGDFVEQSAGGDLFSLL
ncbi:integrase arm-type DNA-binding domain-containing protein [Glaesserella parasuis]|uniref:integrase arm-type DNA-binding domain-containing protein n=1 Tax=Glaesserella parasuis TaxID=738 RepID=UPI0024370539|nr:integrase arm-type DNA-binding domain-containing protein [Glaesserella parasuis]MDG6831989.1 integrase arm-type DNA-binding domain-containing protein [Glaesserella parasuis]